MTINIGQSLNCDDRIKLHQIIQSKQEQLQRRVVAGNQKYKSYGIDLCFIDIDASAKFTKIKNLLTQPRSQRLYQHHQDDQLPLKATPTA